MQSIKLLYLSVYRVLQTAFRSLQIRSSPWPIISDD